jgi:dihydroorotase-like cyclic amidohydrolase
MERMSLQINQQTLRMVEFGKSMGVQILHISAHEALRLALLAKGGNLFPSLSSPACRVLLELAMHHLTNTNVNLKQWSLLPKPSPIDKI